LTKFAVEQLTRQRVTKFDVRDPEANSPDSLGFLSGTRGKRSRKSPKRLSDVAVSLPGPPCIEGGPQTWDREATYYASLRRP